MFLCGQNSEAQIALEDAEQKISQWRKKHVRASQELADVRRHLEEQTSRNAELEKRQRRFGER